ncbi:NAD dependent epimerase/dehydratase family protein [Delphinella strobiligena]|nr:NAD dependent epimerase/dehydratase family protein [Delphinella strobiligena]
MPAKIFILGATGYIGGDALYAIAHAHPEYEITALVRNSEKGAQVASQYPKTKLVYGDTDSADLIAEEVHKADIILHFAMSADDVSGTTSITNALATRKTPAFYIHCSGTGILTFADIARESYGTASQNVFDDWDGIKELTTLPDHALHRNVDKIVLAAGATNPEIVKTAIVSPPTIYGPGRGPGKQSSHQVPQLAKRTLEQGHGIQVGEGKTFWTCIHVQDVSDLFLKLTEAAAAGGGNATWGPEGYYHAENGDIIWGEVAKLVAKSAKKQGFIKDDTVISVTPDEANKLEPYGAVIWGANSRGRAYRAGKLLGWKPSHSSLEEEIPATVEVEARKLGLVPGHAKVAAGDA